jgi:hypothetical protein
MSGTQITGHLYNNSVHSFAVTMKCKWFLHIKISVL